MHHDHLGPSIAVDTSPHDLFPQIKQRASVMIIIDNLNPVFDDNFIKWRLSEHVTSLLDGIVVLGFGVYSRSAIHAKVKVDADLLLIF